MFCPKCGKKSRGLCLECLLEEKPIILRDIRLDVCACGRYRFKERWGGKLGDEISAMVEKNLVAPHNIEITDTGVEYEIKQDKILVHVEVHGIYNTKKFKKKKEFQIPLKKTSCPLCSKISGGYYETIVQFRTKYKPTPKDINIKMVSRMENVRGGVDFYIVDGKYGRQIKKKFKERGFYVKESSKLIGKKSGRNVYQTSISIKEPDFSEGDFMIHKNRILRILTRGYKTRLLDIVTGKHSTLPLRNLSESEIVARGSDAREGIVIAVTPDEVQVMDLKNNKMYSSSNRPQETRNGQDVEIINIRDEIYIVPY